MLERLTHADIHPERLLGAMIDLYLEDLENRIDEAEENALLKSWTDFIEGRKGNSPFVPKRSEGKPAGLLWPVVHINDAISDIDKMVLHQYAGCSAILEEGRNDLPCIRANYGTSIIPSLFGAEAYVMDRKHNTLPTSRPLPGGAAALRRVVDKGVPDIFSGYGENVFEVGRQFKKIAQQYPKIARHIHVYHPDLQGPLDICELLAGSDLFLLVVDEPELVKELLALITETYIRFLREWFEIWPCSGDRSFHWGWLHQGHIMLRNDSMMNLSPDFYAGFAKPFDQRLFDVFGGGAMHFCGRGDHYIDQVGAMPGVYAINMSQPEYNNQEVMFRNTIAKGIKLLGYNQQAVPGALESLGSSARAVHCPASLS